MADTYSIIKQSSAEFDKQLFDSVLDTVYDASINRKLLMNDINMLFFKTAYVVYKNATPVARAVIYYNPQIEIESGKTFLIGNYECIQDTETATYLLQQIVADCKSENVKHLVGSIAGSTWDSYRFSTDNNSPLFLLEPYHHLYYNKQLTDVGFSVLANYISSIDTKLAHGYEEVKNRRTQMIDAGIVFRGINMTDFDNELEQLYDLSAMAFSKNFLYSTISKEHFNQKYTAAKTVINTPYTIIAEDKNQIVGFVFAYPNLLNTQRKEFVIKTLVRNSARKYFGMGVVLVDTIYERAVKEGANAIIHAFMHVENSSIAISGVKYAGEPYKKYALYSIKL